MLRLIHSADWHLGHSLHGVSRAYEHARFLTWLGEQLEQREEVALYPAKAYVTDEEQSEQAEQAAEEARRTREQVDKLKAELGEAKLALDQRPLLEEGRLPQLEQALERFVLTQAHPGSTFSTIPRSADILYLLSMIEQGACHRSFVRNNIQKVPLKV